MKRITAVAGVAALAATAFAFSGSPASAAVCGTTVVEVPGTAYVVLDEAALPDNVSLWIYQESNSEAGLQRNAGAGDACGGEGGDAVLL